MEELKLENIETTEVEAIDLESEEAENGGSLVKVGLGIAAVGACAGALWANRDKIKNKINEKRAEKLRKAGYLVEQIDEVDYEEVEDFDEDETGE